MAGSTRQGDNPAVLKALQAAEVQTPKDFLEPLVSFKGGLSLRLPFKGFRGYLTQYKG